ncbi:type I polyketide synthase [Agrobacterium vitis]|nr:type I polyketide synthase [Agrobacterium vitis]
MNVLVRDESLDEVLDASISREAEPLAIVGMSCRFPTDADTPEKFWQLLVNGRITAGEIPQSRWEAYASSSPKVIAALSSATRHGSFLSDIEGFDADFFGISAREAEYVDPQQRVILELSWEALENAGIPPSSLKGKDVGVYVAANSFDFGHRLMSNLAEIQPWTMNGSMLFAIANRVSYALDLRGPSMVVDTACAGSLTALHLACQALWSNEIPLAIVGGVNIMSNPGMMLALDAAGATAKDGRSKAFDRGANGYGRGEGAGLIVLKKVSEARKANDRILALVRGGSVFQDGRTAGMMAPNPEAQEMMLHKTYERFGIAPSSIAYVEAHGTGTQAGDKAEIGSLSKVFGLDRSEPCLIGSAKPNIGHLEAGAGIAGLIKTVLALENETIPPSVHSDLNDQVDWARSGLKVVSEPTPWLKGDDPRRAGISCFGVGGVISHTIIEEAPADPEEENAPTASAPEYEYPMQVFPISARSQAALRNNAARLGGWAAENASTSLSSIGYTLSLRRDHLPKRAAIVASSRDEFLEKLNLLSVEKESDGLILGESTAGSEKGAVWVFSGHGAQWEGMAKELLSTNSIFADSIDQLGPIFQRELGYTARQAIEESDWSTVERIQALTFAIQIALSQVWKSIGLQPGAVIGHSVGEVAAAVVAGTLDIEDAAIFACRRASIYQRLAGNGAMAMVRLSFDETDRKLAGNDRVVAAIAASTNATVISGDTDVLNQIIAAWKKDHIVVRKVPTIDAAFHSPQIDPLVDDIRDAARHLVTHEAQVPLYTTTLNDPRASDDRGADFWATNSRGAVLLVGAVEAAVEDGYSAFLEVSTAPIVAPSIRETLDASGRDEITVVASLAPNKPEIATILNSLGKLFVFGCPIDWSKLYGNDDLAALPTQAWQHRTFWPTTAINGNSRGFGHSPATHTLLGQAEYVRSSPPLTVWRTQLDFSTRPYPGSHPLFGVEIVPAAALLYSLMSAGKKNGRLAALADIGLHTPVPVDNPLELQIVRQGDAISISTRREDVDTDNSWSWTTHTVARAEEAPASEPATYDIDRLRQRCDELWTWDKVEELYKKRGIGGYGFPWHMLELHRGNGEIWATFTSGEADAGQQRSWAEVLDAALTICPLLLPDDELLRMPSRIGHVTASGPLPERYFVHVARHENSSPNSEDCLLTVQIFNEDSQQIGVMDGVLFGVLDGARSLNSRAQDIVFREIWRPALDSNADDAVLGTVIFVGTSDDCPAAIIEVLKAQKIPFSFANTSSNLTPVEGASVVVLGTGLRNDETVEQAAERNAWTLIDTAQKLTSNEFHSVRMRLLCITQGVRSAITESALAQTTMWGGARIIAGERSDLWAGLYDLQPDHLDQAAATALLKRIASSIDEDVINFEDGQFWSLRLVAASFEMAQNSHKAETRQDGCRSNATYLITGGLGALGLEAARYLTSRGARRIVLAGRSSLPPRSAWPKIDDPIHRSIIDTIMEIEDSGATVTTVSVDVADFDALQTAIETLAVSLPSIKGVVHAAGIFEGGMIGQIEPSSVTRSFAAKVHGAANLHRLFPVGSLDFFVQFSSSGQLGRLTGQSCYAAANSFLDGLARHRNASGTSDSISLGWMAWRGIGMSKSIDATMVEARGRGMDAIDPANALKAWRYCEDSDAAYAAIFTPAIESGSSPLPLFSELLPTDGNEVSGENDASEIPSENRFDWLVGDIRRLVSTELKADEAYLEVKRPLIDMGVDSLMTVSLRVKLRKRYGFEFPPTLLWNSPSVHAIAQFVDKNLQNQPEHANA